MNRTASALVKELFYLVEKYNVTSKEGFAWSPHNENSEYAEEYCKVNNVPYAPEGVEAYSEKEITELIKLYDLISSKPQKFATYLGTPPRYLRNIETKEVVVVFSIAETAAALNLSRTALSKVLNGHQSLAGTWEKYIPTTPLLLGLTQ